LRRSLAIVLLALVPANLILFSSPSVHQVYAASNSNAQNATLYWHYQNTPVLVAGIQTNYVLNSSSNFDFQSNSTAMQYSIYKSPAASAVTMDFYAYPNLAGPLLVNGTWAVWVYVNDSISFGYRPVSFSLEFREFPLGSSTPTWDSGQLSPVVLGEYGSYVDWPVYFFRLATPTALVHTFAQGSIIDVSVTVNDGSVNARIWYDTPLYQSRVVLPVMNPGQPAKIWVSDSAGVVRTDFPATGQTITVTANITDPLGGYEVKGATLYLTVNGKILVNFTTMTQVSGGPTAFNNIFQYGVPISGTAGYYEATVYSGNQLSYTFTVGGGILPPFFVPSLTSLYIIIGVGIASTVALVLVLKRLSSKKRSQAEKPNENSLPF
jgi:hypothetical protein